MAFCYVLVAVVIMPILLVGQLLSGSYPTRSVLQTKTIAGRYAPFRTFGIQWYPLHLLMPMTVYAGMQLLQMSKSDAKASIILLSVIIISACWLTARSAVIDHNRRARQAGARPAETQEEPGLLVAYLKARKEKFCPTVTFN